MSSVKIIEIVAGIMVLIPKTRLLGLLVLAPIIFGITLVQLEFNFRKSWVVFLQTILPYLILLGDGGPRLLTLVREIL